MAKFQDVLKYTAIQQTKKESLIGQFGEDFMKKNFPDWGEDDTLIGLEIEVENTPHPIYIDNWVGVMDGSLRDNGVEYRTFAFPATWAPALLQRFYEALKATNKTYAFTDRTSIHVHIDFRNNEIFDLVKLLLVYSVFDRLLFKKVCPTRSKNIYCVSLSDMLIGSSTYTDVIERYKKDPATVTWEDMHLITNKLCSGKYAAINPLNLFVRRQERGDHTGSGSIEFRHLHGTDDQQLICRWIKLLLCLKQYISKTPFADIQKQIEILNTSSEYQNYTYSVFKEQTPFLLPYYEHDANIKLIAEGITAAKQILAHKTLPLDGGDFLKSKLANILQRNILVPIANREKEAEEELRQALRRNVIAEPQEAQPARRVRVPLQRAGLNWRAEAIPVPVPDVAVDFIEPNNENEVAPPPPPVARIPGNLVPPEEVNPRNLDQRLIRFDLPRAEWVWR